jgi:hypothetical protein
MLSWAAGGAVRVESEGADVRGFIRTGRAVAAVTVLALLAAGAWGAGAGATVPPKNCGLTTVNSKRYQIKADQIRCGTAMTYARRYLSRHARPSGYRCTDFGSTTKLKFRCAKGKRVFFAIKR